jgi:hypothetical protein
LFGFFSVQQPDNEYKQQYRKIIQNTLNQRQVKRQQTGTIDHSYCAKQGNEYKHEETGMLTVKWLDK